MRSLWFIEEREEKVGNDEASVIDLKLKSWYSTTFQVNQSKRRPKMTLRGGGELDESWSKVSAKRWPRLGQTRRNLVVQRLNREEVSRSYGRSKIGLRKAVVVRPRRVVQGGGWFSRVKVREERESLRVKMIFLGENLEYIACRDFLKKRFRF